MRTLLTIRLWWPVLMVLPASGMTAQATPPKCGAHGVALQVLGSGGPELQDGRASSSYLIWRDGVAKVLIDSGGGSALNFGRSGATVADLDVILLTHLHVDHTADLAALVKSSYFEDRHRELPLYGPAGNAAFPATTSFVRTLFAAPGGAFRYLDEFVTPGAQDAYLLEPHDLRLEQHEIRRIEVPGGVMVRATPVIHGGVPALAYRIEMDGISMAFSGDTNGDNGNLEKLASHADLFVAHNAVREGATGVERALHMPPSVIGRIAGTAHVRKLILSHRMLRTLGQESETERAVRRGYSGSLVFADDLTCVPVSRAE